ncbi:MFS transporter [Planctomycetes bacterium TBK1r]|uniref:Spermidine synthase n=1 Tax=Stieleria magnilauensis TaxID=2527963 RepID=A0ABX5XVA0_9BACT|nr:Spermidine synthase [Planctomycetes bacterium TBK1r]
MPTKRFGVASTLPLLLLFFVSGATTLVYEISWTRQAGLLFGHTVLAGSVVLASLFLGLAIGYSVGGRLSASGSSLRWFGVLEIAAAAWAICVPTLLSVLQSQAIVAWMSSESMAWQFASRASIGVLLLLPATVALGATLPLMSQALARVSDHPTRSAAIGYAFNTAGAMAGTLVCTYLLLVQVGVARSSYAAAGVAVLAGVIAIVLSRTQMAEVIEVLDPENPAETLGEFRYGEDDEEPRGRRTNVTLAIAAISGFATLALEILYTRLFSLVFHNSTYTFGNVVAVFLLALAVGAALVAALMRRVKPDAILFWCGIAATVSCCLCLALFVNITRLQYFVSGETFVGHLLRGFILVFAYVMLPVTICGMIFPATWQVLARSHSTGRAVGTLAMVNAVGAALGSLAASFAMLPTIGLWGGFLVVAALLLLIALLSGFIAPARFSGHHATFSYGRSVAIAFGGLCVVGVGFASSSWSLLGRDPDEVFLTRRESAYGWIDVTRSKDSEAWYIRQNLHYRLGGTGAAATRERRQARLPMLLHPNPQRVLFLGMGTGVTAAGAIQHPETETIEIVELIADVTAAARELGHRNDHVLEDDRVHVTTDDARHFLLGTSKKFDVIVSDLFVPWESETGYLYTEVHYAAAAKRLEKGGLFCQWLPIYQMGEREFTMIADTFATVFPETTLWWGKMDPSKPIIGLVGSMRPIEIDTTALASRLDRLRRIPGGNDPQLTSLDDLRLASIGQWPTAGNSMLNRDEYPRVEFWTPRSLMAGELLRGAWLARFYAKVLTDLPPASVNSGPEKFFRNPEQIRGGRQTQRFLVFGQ